MISASIKAEHDPTIPDGITPSEHETAEEITKIAKNILVKYFKFSEEEVDI